MAKSVIFPKLGQTMEEGAIVKWLKKEGDKIAKGDILFEIETDKANLEVESFFEGTLIKVLVAEGITVPVDTVVGYIGEPGEKIPDTPPAPATEVAGSDKVAAPAPAPAAAPAPAPTTEVAGSDKAAAPAPAAKPAPAPVAAPAPAPAPRPAAPAPAAPAAKLVISPRAKALARDKAIDPSKVKGSGPNGRIESRDVEAYLAANNYDAIRIAPAAKCLAQQNAIDILTVRGSGESGRILVADIERAIKAKPVALSRMRQVIARRLTESKQTIPHFYVTVNADMTDLMKFRAELKAQGIKYSVNDFILSAVVQSLEEFPRVNSWTDGKVVAERGDVDLGVAVSVDQGLVVPVVRGAQFLTLAELSAQAKTLATKAREGKLLPDEMTGSGFTVSNMGMMGVDQFQAIINPGESAILAVSSTREKPAVVNGEIKIRQIMAMTLSVDHRIIDGSLGAEFLNAVRAKLENLELWKALV